MTNTHGLVMNNLDEVAKDLQHLNDCGLRAQLLYDPEYGDLWISWHVGRGYTHDMENITFAMLDHPASEDEIADMLYQRILEANTAYLPGILDDLLKNGPHKGVLAEANDRWWMKGARA